MHTKLRRMNLDEYLYVINVLKSHDCYNDLYHLKWVEELIAIPSFKHHHIVIQILPLLCQEWVNKYAS